MCRLLEGRQPEPQLSTGQATPMKRILLYVSMIGLVSIAFEIISSVFVLYLYRETGNMPVLYGEPALSSAVVCKKLLKRIFPEAFVDKARMLVDPYPYLKLDADLGFSSSPGKYVFTYRKKNKDGDFVYFKNQVTINPDRTRFVGNHRDGGSQNVYVFGSSSVFGHGVNDEQTFTSLLQQRYQNNKFFLYAQGGYSLVQAYINFEKIKHTINGGDTIVLAYGSFYKAWDVAAPSRLRQYGEPNERIFDDRIKQPKASILDSGKIQIDYVPIYCKFHRSYCESKDPSTDEMDKVAARLINDIAEQTKAKIILLHFSGSRDDRVLKMISNKVHILSALTGDFDYQITDDIMGFDAHPGPYWHYAIYKRLSESGLL
jgi:hypothetical protein